MGRQAYEGMKSGWPNVLTRLSAMLSTASHAHQL